jgi:hypothetical protein
MPLKAHVKRAFSILKCYWVDSMLRLWNMGWRRIFQYFDH